MSKSDKDEFRNKESIMREHLCLMPDDDKSKDKFTDGFDLRVTADDDDDFHVRYHTRFLSDFGDTITTRGRHRLQNHIKKHEFQKKMKSKMFGGHSKYRNIANDVFDSFDIE